jgi:hypothetical protein
MIKGRSSRAPLIGYSLFSLHKIADLLLKRNLNQGEIGDSVLGIGYSIVVILSFKHLDSPIRIEYRLMNVEVEDITKKVDKHRARPRRVHSVRLCSA